MQFYKVRKFIKDTKFNNLKSKIKNQELKIYIYWRLSKLVKIIKKPLFPILNLINFPKYIYLVFIIYFTKKVDEVSFLFNKIKRYGYENLEGFLIPEQIQDIVQHIKIDYEVLEIGFNFGHTSEGILNNTNCSLTTVDNFSHMYSWVARAFMKNKYKNRITFYKGNSVNILKKLISNGKRYDLIFIDGGHTYEVCLEDIKNSLLLLKSKSFLLIDNLEIKSVEKAIKKYLDNNSISFVKSYDYSQLNRNLSDIGLYEVN